MAGSGAPQRQGKSRSTRAAGAAVAVLLLGIAAISLPLWWFAAKRSRQPRNVLLITIDTLRADAVGAYGNGRRTPVDRPAGVGGRPLHQRARAQRRHAALPREHPLRPAADRARRPRQRRVPSRALASTRSPRSSRRTATAPAPSSARFPLDSRFGLARGFDVYDDRFADAARPAFLVQERSGRRRSRAPRAGSLRADGHRGSAGSTSTSRTIPYAPPEPFASRFAASLSR